MKRMISAICAALLALSLFGCGVKTSKDLSNSTVTGKVTAINGSSIILQLGELTGSSSGTAPSGGGTASGAAPSGAPSGNVPSGQAPSGDIPSGNAPSGGGNASGSSASFKAGETSVTITADDSVAVTVEGAASDTKTTAADIAVDDVLEVTFGDNNTVTAVTVKNLSGGNSGGGFGGSSTVTNGTAANTITEDTTVSDSTYTSTGDDENALRVDGSTVTLSGITIEKTSGESSNTENGDFYGQNAGLLALNGAQVTIKGATVNTSVKNGNGVFSYGYGTTVNISDSKITTTGNNSGGIQTTGGATTNASNLNVSTAGNSAAAIRSDRGGGTVVVDGGTYATSGTGSPTIYSTADITAKNSTLTALNSEAIVVEGLNSVTLENCDLTGNMTGTYNGDGTENIHNIMLYQSMSGDAEVGTSSFSATGGSIKATTGDMFYVTNTNSKISLDNVELALANGTLLKVAGNSSSRGWGTAGQNGGKVTFTASNMTLAGNITVDSISTLNFTLADGCSFKGTVNIVNNEANGTTVSDNAVITVAKGATWTLSGNCKITSLTDNGTINFNGYKIVLADGTVLNG